MIPVMPTALTGQSVLRRICRSCPSSSHENMANLKPYPDQPVEVLAADLRRAFSGIVAGNERGGDPRHWSSLARIRSTVTRR